MDELNIAVNYIKSLQDTTKQKIVVLYLDGQDRVIFTTCHVWSAEGREIYPKQIAEMAARMKANKVIVIHDQPSGNISPSKKDKQLATDVMASLRTLNIELRDYIINAGEHRYYSMADNRYLARGH
jgi:DNA repair protein RadC